MDDYEIASIETKPTDPLMDNGTGSAAIIRWFDLIIPESVQEDQLVSKEELIFANNKNITASAWADGLSLVGELRCVEVKPRHYRIGGLFKARPGATILETTKSLQEINENA